jgi:hypothetical protein
MMLKNKLSAINDIEGKKVSNSFPLIIDAHIRSRFGSGSLPS